MVSKFLAFKLVVVEEAPVDGVFNQWCIGQILRTNMFVLVLVLG
jgi:hypothetical protein